MLTKVDCHRSRIMRSVKNKDTAPEMIVRRFVYSLGYRYRLHRSDLPGKPDLVFGPRRKLIFVNGCFWHGHTCKRGNRQPKNNAHYWREKIQKNRERDASNIEKLRALGWEVLVVWECETKQERMKQAIESFLRSINQTESPCNPPATRLLQTEFAKQLIQP
ncbi:very short patch repair endonuclease [Ruegeria sp. ANG10]|uniref:very short patch repair endonuclease n=1 Tax=Ruegeria sp. ANG10 TaxID=3042467 RepID=UPI003452BA1B